MTDEELCKALRSALWGRGHHINIKAADRIEQLQQALKDQSSVSDRLAEQLEQLVAIAEELEKERDRVAAINVNHCRTVNAYVVDNARLADRAKASDAKLAKTVEALRFYAPQTVGGITFLGGDDAGKRAAALLAEIDPEELARWREEAVQAEREARAKLRYFHPEGETMAQMRDHARNHPLYREGDLKLVWVNEGDLYNLAIRATLAEIEGEKT